MGKIESAGSLTNMLLTARKYILLTILTLLLVIWRIERILPVQINLQLTRRLRDAFTNEIMVVPKIFWAGCTDLRDFANKGYIHISQFMEENQAISTLRYIFWKEDHPICVWAKKRNKHPHLHKVFCDITSETIITVK